MSDKLLTEIEIVEFIKYTPNKVTLCNKVLRAQLTKVREVVEGAGLTDEEMEKYNDPWKSNAISQWIDEWDIGGLLKAHKQAILKAIGGKG